VAGVWRVCGGCVTGVSGDLLLWLARRACRYAAGDRRLTQQLRDSRITCP
jgi:hypothetical protein